MNWIKTSSFFLIFLFVPLFVLGCETTARKEHKPSAMFAGKKFAVILLQSPSEAYFTEEQFTRLVRQWDENSPGFHEQMAGISYFRSNSRSLPAILSSLEENLKSRSDLLVILVPKKFMIQPTNAGGGSGKKAGEQPKNEAEFLVSVANVKENRELGSFVVKASTSDEKKDPLVDRLAYEIAIKAGFGWKL